MAAKKTKRETKTVTRYSKTSGTKVTVSEDTAKRLGSGFVEKDPNSKSSSRSSSSS